MTQNCTLVDDIIVACTNGGTSGVLLSHIDVLCFARIGVKVLVLVIINIFICYIVYLLNKCDRWQNVTFAKIFKIDHREVR